MTKKLLYAIFMVFTFVLMGCNDNDDIPLYTQTELESFLIRDCEDASYYFDDEGLYFTFDFKKNSRGNIGEYHRDNLYELEYKDCDFIWDVEPYGDGGIVTMNFEEEGKRIRLQMKLMDQHYYDTIINQDGTTSNVISWTKQLWKLDFKLKDDPFK